jgi:penicillin-binding protein 2
MVRSIVVSCDTYYYMLAGDTDIDDTHAFLSQFGFGKETGIDIEGELPGVLPSREWKRERFSGKNYREEHRKWYLGDSISAGIGQGYNAFTPMQQAQAIAIFANDGVAFQPHVVKSIENVRSGEVLQIAPQPAHKLSVKPEHLAVIKTALAGVPREGTSARAFVDASTPPGVRPEPRSCSRSRKKYTAGRIDDACATSVFIAYAGQSSKIALAVLVGKGASARRRPPLRAVFDYFLLGRQYIAPALPVPVREPDDEATGGKFSRCSPGSGNFVRRVDWLSHVGGAGDRRGLVTLFSASDLASRG